MERASDSLKYIKNLEYDKYGQDEYYYFGITPPNRLQEKLDGQRFDCPNCAKRSVKVLIDQDLLTDNYFIRVHCYSCLAYVLMQVTPFALKSANFDLMAEMINDAVLSLKNTSEVDLDAMIDKDWELAGG